MIVLSISSPSHGVECQSFLTDGTGCLGLPHKRTRTRISWVSILILPLSCCGLPCPSQVWNVRAPQKMLIVGEKNQN